MKQSFALLRRVAFAVIAAFCLSVVFFAFQALADAAPAVTDADLLTQALQIFKDWKTVGVWGGAVLVVNLLVNATKTPLLGGLFHKLSDGAQVILIGVLSAAAVGLPVLASGGSWAAAVAGVLTSSSGAMLLNELMKRLFGINLPASS